MITVAFALVVLVALVALVAAVVLVRQRVSAAKRMRRVTSRFAADSADQTEQDSESNNKPNSSFDHLVGSLESLATTASRRANLAELDMARWRQAIDVLPVGVVLTDENGTICATNALADELTSARDAMALVGAGVAQLLQSALEGQDRSRTVRLTGPPSRIIEISAHGVAQNPVAQNPVRQSLVAQGPAAQGAHARLGAVAVITDSTEGVRTDEVRRDFVANLSHELRTPIGAIALLAETLADDNDTTSCRLAEDSLVQRIIAETDRMQHIIEDLLELSRVELEGSMRRETLPIMPLLSEVVHQYSEHARSHGVSLVRLSSPDVTISGDRGQLLRAVGNLVDNAVKYSDPGSQVRLSAMPSAQHLSSDDPSSDRDDQLSDALAARVGLPKYSLADMSTDRSWDHSCDIVVHDEGIGIPSDETERIFERFYRVDKARARATGGTGLGLSIVRHVVMNHGGEVILQTREGVGTKFTLRLPCS